MLSVTSELFQVSAVVLLNFGCCGATFCEILSKKNRAILQQRWQIGFQVHVGKISGQVYFVSERVSGLLILFLV